MKDQHSFIIPAYGDSPYLEQCIHSLVHQSVKSSIIITTSTPSKFISDAAQKYQIEVLINSEGNNGIGNDWNFAYSQAKTPLVTLAHQDELYHPEFTETVINYNNRIAHKEAIILFTDYQEMIGDKINDRPSSHARIKKLLLIPFLLKPRIASRTIKKAVLSLGSPICCPSVTFHKSIIKDFSFSTRYKAVLDWAAWLTLANQKGYFCYINKKLITHRIHSEAETFRQIQSGLRYSEELDIFSSIWGKALAKFLMKFYVYGHRINTKSE
jgi:glycosyltransferase involved in cell wall biosynthesis